MQMFGIPVSETDKNGGRSQTVSENDKNIVKRQPLRINHFNETLTLSTNPIYDKLKKLFKYDKHQDKIDQNAQDAYRTVRPLQVDVQSKYLLGLNTKNQSFGQNKSLMFKGNKTTVVTQPESLLMENFHAQINHQRLSKEISGQELMKVRPSDLQNLALRDQKKMLLENHRIKRVLKPKIKHPRQKNAQICDSKENQRITLIDENKQNEQPNSKKTNSNENMRNFEFLQQKISFLEEQLSYYHTMEEFYLEELSNYRENQRHLEWKLQLVTEELLMRAGKSQKCQLSSQIEEGSSNSSADGKYETKRYDTTQIIRISKNSSSGRKHETFTLEDVALVESQDQFQPNPQLNKLSASTLSQEPRNLIFF